MTIRIGKYRGGGWEVDLRITLPNGQRVRERVRSPIPSRSGTQRWAEARAAELALHGKVNHIKKEVPTIAGFKARYVDEYAKANQQKPSTIIQKENIIDHYLVPRFGSKRLDELSASDIQKLKAALTDLSPKTVNNVLIVLNTMLKCAVKWQVIERMPVIIELLKVARVG